MLLSAITRPAAAAHHSLYPIHFQPFSCWCRGRIKFRLVSHLQSQSMSAFQNHTCGSKEQGNV